MTCDRGQKGLNLGRRIWWPFIESDFRFFLSSGLEPKNRNEIGKDNKFHNNYRFKYKKNNKIINNLWKNISIFFLKENYIGKN